MLFGWAECVMRRSEAHPHCEIDGQIVLFAWTGISIPCWHHGPSIPGPTRHALPTAADRRRLSQLSCKELVVAMWLQITCS